jgi:carboxyl-terminal processing protease
MGPDVSPLCRFVLRASCCRPKAGFGAAQERFRMRLRQLLTFLVVACALSAFLAGFTFREVLAAVEPGLVAQGGLPESVATARATSMKGTLSPLSAYSRALGYLKENYYGELPGDRQLTYAAIRGMLRTLDDPYTRFLDPEAFRSMSEENRGEFVGIGAYLEERATPDGYIRISHAQSDTPAQRAGLQPGDVLLKVNGISMRYKDVDTVSSMIRGRANSSVKLTLRRRGVDRPIELKIIRKPIQYEVVDAAIKAGDIGYISLRQFNEVCDGQVDQAISRFEQQGVKGLILDLRSNPGGMLTSAQEIASRFVPTGKPVVHIVERGGRRNSLLALESKQNHRALPLVVLVNRMSASASEIVAGAVKDWKAGTIVGTRTYGKGLVQTVIPLSDGSAVAITTAKYLTPNGIDINVGTDHPGGITPDVTVDISESDFANAHDTQLETAIRLLKRQIAMAH